MPTLLGSFFLCTGLYCALARKKSLFGLLIFSCIFQGSYALRFGERGIQCCYVVEAFIVLRAVAGRILKEKPTVYMPRGAWLLTFATISVVTAFVSPLLFAGIPVYDPLNGIDDGLLIRPPLHLGFNNLVQIVFLVLHIATAYSVCDLGFSLRRIRRAFVFTFYFALLCILAQAATRMTGLPFPNFLLRNNHDVWDFGASPPMLRNPGTFLEPSFAGAFLVLCCTGFVATYFAGKGSGMRVALSLLGTGMVTSSGSLFTQVGAVCGLALAFPPLARHFVLKLRRAGRLLWILLILTLPVVVALSVGDLRAMLAEQTVSKGDTGSFFNRTVSDLYALDLLRHTYGIGVGIGSNRASSLVTSLGSTTGVAGCFAFFMFCIPLFLRLRGENAWLKWAGMALLTNMVIDVPDITFPHLWIAIMLAVAAHYDARPERHSKLSEKSDAQDELPVRFSAVSTALNPGEAAGPLASSQA